MNKGYNIVNIKNYKDINNINSSTKYINLDITSLNKEIISYFLDNGQNYSYSDSINNHQGYIYVDYNTFKLGEEIIEGIINKIPNNFKDIEKARYLYITLGKILTFDINTISEKNDIVSFENLSLINNIWGSLAKGKTTNTSLSKLYLYLCSRLNIKCELITINAEGHLANSLFVDNKNLIVNLTKDIHNISGGFPTEYFASYNRDLKLDRKIGYIKSDYTDVILSNKLGKLDYTKEETVYEILKITEKILNIPSIGSIELSKIYKNIFKEYCPNYDIKINNFFIYSQNNSKEHFILISHNGKHYSFNYNKNHFIQLKENDIFNNIKEKRIGLYNNECFTIEGNELIA